MALPIYKINGKDLRSTYKIQVLKSGGIFDHVARLGNASRDWHEENGEEPIIDEIDLGWKQREIVIKCLMEFNDIYDFQDNLGALKELIYSKVVTLETPYTSHEVLLKKGSKVVYDNEHQDNAEFTLVFNEIEFDPGTGLIPVENLTNDIYSIGGVDFERLGIKISKSTGYFDFTSMKTDGYTFYKKESNKVNSRLPRYIELDIDMVAQSATELVENHNNLQSILRQPNLVKLIIKDVTNEFEVYNKDGYKLNTFYISDGLYISRFKLRLVEPYPKIENLTLAYLLDVDLNYIIDELDRYIVVLVDRESFASKTQYLFTDSEPDGNEVYLYTDSEIAADETKEDVYLFTETEI